MKEKDRFDYCVSNPPYQLKAASTNANFSIYPNYMFLGTLISDNASFIHPNRAFSSSANSDKRIVEKLNNSFHIKNLMFSISSEHIFNKTRIRAGISISYFNKNTRNEKKYLEYYESVMNHIGKRLRKNKNLVFYDKKIKRASKLRLFNNEIFETNIFSKNPDLFLDEVFEKKDEYYSVLGFAGKRMKKYIKKENVIFPEEWENVYRLVIPAASGHGFYWKENNLGSPMVLSPEILTTLTFLIVGIFDNEKEAINCRKYLQTKFARGLLAALKNTQHNTSNKWHYVPVLENYCDDDFWGRELDEIDEDLYKMFDFTDEEKEFFRKNIHQWNN